MAIPFCRSMQLGNTVSQTIAVPLHQITRNDLRNYYDAVHETSEERWLKTEDDCLLADFKYCADEISFANWQLSAKTHPNPQKQKENEKAAKDFQDLSMSLVH